MESVIKEALNTTVLKPTGQGGGGCINEGEVYLTDHGKVFIKKNGKSEARLMFDGEYEALKAIDATGTVRVPKPLVVVDNPNHGAAIVMEYVQLKGLHRKSNLLGQQLANFHLHNPKLEEKWNARQQFVGSNEKEADQSIYVTQFGFHTKTCCGYIPQSNDWCDDWPVFYGKKLEEQFKLLEKEASDREAISLWSSLSVQLSHFFEGLQVKPSLLHGDLWSGNAAENEKEPIIFDPASFYGHHEYDLAIMAMFGGFGSSFWNSYQEIIPRVEGWTKRHHLYKLFHTVNHWNHFGAGYRSQTISIMKNLLK